VATITQGHRIYPKTPRRTPGSLKALYLRLRPKPLYWQHEPCGVRVRMAGKPERSGLITRLLHRPPNKAATPDWDYVVFKPQVFWPASSFADKIRVVLQFAYKAGLGYVLNIVGLGFFAFAYYMSTQNPAVQPHWNAPLWIVSIGALAAWTLTRHLLVRGAGEWLFRLTFGWLAFTNPLSKGRQRPDQPTFVWAMDKAWVIPSEAEGTNIPWYRRLVQIVLAPFTVFVASAPGLLVVFGAYLLIGLFDSSLYDSLAANVPKYAATLGAIMFGRMVFSQLAVTFQAMVIDLFKDHDWPMKWWMGIPAQVRAYYNSDLSPRFGRGTWWRGPVLVIFPVLVLLGWIVGNWILHNVPYLGSHTIFSAVGFHHMLHTLPQSIPFIGRLIH
jgi:hypothetical protein